MTGASVVWTAEMRERASERMRQKRASESPSQKVARLERRAETWASLPQEAKSKRAKKISRTRKARGMSSEISKKAWANKSEEAKQASLVNLALHSSPKAVRKREATKALKRDEINAKTAESVKYHWNSLSLEDKHSRVKKALTACSGKYQLVDGSTRFFHSSWEAACADVLLTLGCTFSTQERFCFGDILYYADFVLPGRIIVEVKGAPKAWKRWNAKTYPALVQHLDPRWSLYMLTFKPSNRYHDLNEFLTSMMHVRFDPTRLSGDFPDSVKAIQSLRTV